MRAWLRVTEEEGARLVALHWLGQLGEARERWRDEAGGALAADTASSDNAVVLHRARVALRRLRATLREHRAVLDLPAKLERRLRTLNHATNSARDLDVQRAWLAAECDSLASPAREQALLLSAALGRDVAERRREVGQSFRRHLDPTLPRLRDALSTFEQTRHVGRPFTPRPFAERMADRVRAGAEKIAAELTEVSGGADSRPGIAMGDDAIEFLHALRIRLKRQRAMLAPFTDVDPMVGRWYDLATRGQDQLGAMRDAALLAELANQAGHTALAHALREAMLGHADAFRDGWCSGAERIATIREVAERAAGALVVRAAGGGVGVSDAADIDAADGEPPREIERKYLLRGLPPEAAAVPPIEIEQGWLPGAVLRERLRRSRMPDGTARHTRTVKFGPLGSRVELEEDATPDLFDALWPFTAAARIRKHRHAVAAGRFTWEIDAFLDQELVLAEVELGPADTVPAPPDWLTGWIVRDVTEDPSFTNSAMARGATPVPDAEPER